MEPSLALLALEVGAGCRWAGIADVADFLRGALDPQRYEGVRAAWLEPGRALLDQLPQIIHADALTSLVQTNSTALLEVLQEGRIESWFQPIFRGGTLELWGYECLMRGRTADGGLIPPATLLEWARQERLVFMLDRVAREAHLRAAGRNLLPAECRILINFLPTAIYQPEFCLASTVRTARETGIAPHRIGFEVVESEQVVDRAHLRDILQHYRDAGFLVALDDVGSGYAGLSMLGDLAPDIIKIDREMVQKAVTSRAHESICASLVSLAREGGQLALAEGIETREEWELVERLGVHLLQGYLFGRPSPTPATAALVGAGNPPG